MRILSTRAGRYVIGSLIASGILLVTPSIALAQGGFGIGGRMAWVKPDSDADVDSIRYIGGQIRLVSSRWGLEVAMDRHTEEFEALNQKVTETPVQASLLLRMGSSNVAPYLLGGPGWYKRKVELIEGPDEPDADTTEFGWHAGGGLEVLAGKHLGIHGDYRFTFLDFGDDDDDEEDKGFITGLLPGHRGSMFTVGLTVYF